MIWLQGGSMFRAGASVDVSIIHCRNRRCYYLFSSTRRRVISLHSYSRRLLPVSYKSAAASLDHSSQPSMRPFWMVEPTPVLIVSRKDHQVLICVRRSCSSMRIKAFCQYIVWNWNQKVLKISVHDLIDGLESVLIMLWRNDHGSQRFRRPRGNRPR